MSSPEDLESVIIELVKEFLSKKTFSSITEIIDFIIYRVRSKDITRVKIEMILKSLLKKKIIIPGTRLMKNNIIENPQRNEIFNHIKKNPGLNINEIMRDQGIGSNHALWHLSALEKFKFIRSKKYGNRRVFFVFNSNPEFDDYYYYLRSDIVQEILDFLKKEKNALKITNIADELKKNHNTIKKYLGILTNLKLITIEKQNKKDVYKLDLKNYTKFLKMI